jgi:hypothetical protein
VVAGAAVVAVVTLAQRLRQRGVSAA